MFIRDERGRDNEGQLYFYLFFFFFFFFFFCNLVGSETGHMAINLGSMHAAVCEMLSRCEFYYVLLNAALNMEWPVRELAQDIMPELSVSFMMISLALNYIYCSEGQI